MQKSFWQRARIFLLAYRLSTKAKERWWGNLFCNEKSGTLFRNQRTSRIRIFVSDRFCIWVFFLDFVPKLGLFMTVNPPLFFAVKPQNKYTNGRAIYSTLTSQQGVFLESFRSKNPKSGGFRPFSLLMLSCQFQVTWLMKSDLLLLFFFIRTLVLGKSLINYS